MFVGREQELKVLNQQYHSRNFEFSVVYGRRRVGKTTLIKQFCNEHKYIYMMALENNMEENLKALSKTVLQLLSPNESQLVFSSFEQLFDYITPFVMKEQIILIMDEYPYLAQSYPSISSLLQKFIDHEWLASNLFLLLCGSVMSFMENQVLGYKSPLYGRRTSQLKILSFSYLEARSMYPKLSNEEQVFIYTFTGGIPEYLASLITLGIIQKEKPINEPSSKKSMYSIKDQMYRFWYTFVYPNLSLIELGVFKKKKVPFFQSIGRWWGNNPHLKRQEEIDILVLGKTYLLGVCKWQNGEVERRVLLDLEEQGNLFPNVEKEYYVFAKNGFSAQRNEYAKDKGIHLRTLEDLYKIDKEGSV